MTAVQQVRRPLVGIACSLVSGLYMHHLFSGSPCLFLGLAAGTLSWACRMQDRRGALPAFYLTCVLLAAAAGAIEKIETPASSTLPQAEVLFQEQELIGIVDECPAGSGGETPSSFRCRAEAVRVGAEWYRSDAVLRVYLKNPVETPVYGERWRVKGRYRSYEERRAGLEGFLSATDATRLRAAPLSFRGNCYKARQCASRFLYSGIESFPEQAQLLQALLLGYRKALSSELYQLFASTGTLHIFAISGLHVGVLAAIGIAVLKLIGVPRPAWGLLLIPVLFCYVVSTGMKPSAFRAFTMAAVYFAAPLFGRRPDPVSAIALAAIILLSIHPSQISEPGFLLSFTVVSGIVMVHGYVTHRLTGFSRPGWFLPLAKLSGSRPLGGVVRAVGLLTLTSIAAWLFSAPLTARFFNTLSPVALVGNLAIIPLTFIIVLTGCLALLAAPASFFMTGVFNHANRLFVSLLISTIEILGALPGAYTFVRAPSLSVLAVWYTGLVLLFTGTARLRRSGAGLLLVAVLLWSGGLFRPFSGIEIHREGAEVTIMRISSMEWVLVTDGNAYSTSRTIRRLQREGVNHLQALVVSDRRAEVEAIGKLCRLFAPKQVWMPVGLEGTHLAETPQESGSSVIFSDRPEWKTGNGYLRIANDAY